MTILITGAAGFIGSNCIHFLHQTTNYSMVNLDALTYAGNPDNLIALQNSPRYTFVHGSILDQELLTQVFQQHKPGAVIHFAAESHVDRSIHDPEAFIQTNFVGTFRLLEATRSYWNSLDKEAKDQFRFLHVSTDEVYGTLGPTDPPFSETTPYAPNSPYAASKASSDHLVRSYHETYCLPTLTTNCSNNYGPYQFPEKLIPLVIHRALDGKPLPIYGDGQQIRDWLYVEDHCSAIYQVLNKGAPGQVYNIGGWNEQTNLSVVHTICDLLDSLSPKADGTSYRTQITFVTDRPGHDRRYAINSQKIHTQLGWKPKETFTTGLEKTVRWYLDNTTWVKRVTSGAYRNWISSHYGDSRE